MRPPGTGNEVAQQCSIQTSKHFVESVYTLKRPHGLFDSEKRDRKSLVTSHIVRNERILRQIKHEQRTMA